MFVIQTQPTPRDSWPQEFRNLPGYEFWEWDSIQPDRWSPLDRGGTEYNVRVARLTWDLGVLLKHLAESESETARCIPDSADSSTLELAAKDAAWLGSKRERREYDVFLCHNTEDKTAVKQIGELLIGKRIVPWLDEWDLRPGLPWQETLEGQIEQIKSAAVFVGESGFGPWQNMELAALLREFAVRRCPVIPVILSACKNPPQLPTFLRGFTWVDFRKAAPEPVGLLIWGTTGKRPGTR